MKALRTGFTLVELLLVIAIIAVLVAIALPVAGRAREAAWQSACAANLRQLGIAVRQYSLDHEGYLPDLSWDTQHRQIALLRMYVRDAFDLFHCPVSVRRKDLWPAWYTYACAPLDGTNRCTTYKMNDNQQAIAGHQIASLAHPSWTVLALDTDWADRARHNGKDNVVFLDGHVQTKTRAELMDADPNGRGPWWWWGTSP